MFYGEHEGTGYQVLDPRFNACIIGHAGVERLWTGARWSEGPAWLAAGRYLVWSGMEARRAETFEHIGPQEQCDWLGSRQPIPRSGGAKKFCP